MEERERPLSEEEFERKLEINLRGKVYPPLLEHEGK